MIPPLQAVILPLKLLVVEYLWTCDSALVNPVVFAEAQVSANLTYINPELTPSTSPVPGSTSSDDMKSTNDDNMLLNYNDFLIKSVHERRYSVIMKKLSDDIINQWTGKVPHWSCLDPYSNLEDEGSDKEMATSSEDSKNTESSITEDTSDAQSSINSRQWTLQPHKRIYACDRPRQSHTASVFYRSQCSTPRRSSTTASTTDTKPKMNASGPSLDRIEAWRYNLKSLKKPDYTYPVIQEKLKHKESSSTEDNTESDSESDSDKTILVTPANSDQEPGPVGVDPPEDCPVPKGQFHTKTFGVKKPASPVPKKCKRNYPCKECDLNFTNMSEFNWHYKDHHKLIECEDCGLSFNMPSSLKCHVYTHKELKYVCPHCGKKFPFSSNRDVHAIKHETVKQFVCKKCK